MKVRRIACSLLFLLMVALSGIQSAQSTTATSLPEYSTLTNLPFQFIATNNQSRATLPLTNGWKDFPVEKVEQVRASATKGAAVAQFVLGMCYFFGQGVEQ